MLNVENIEFNLNKKIVFDNISINFEVNKIYGIVAESDVDTTILLKCLANILDVNKGVITYNQFLLKNNLKYLKEVVLLDDNYYFNAFNLYLLTKYIALSKDVYLDKGKYDELVKKFNFNDRKPFFNMSKGMIRIAYFIMVFSLGSKVILIDEFLDGIDLIQKHQIKELLIEHSKNDDVIIIMVSNSVTDINDICNEVIILANGTLKRQITIDKLNELYVSYQFEVKDNLNVDDFSLFGLDIKGYKAFDNIREITIPNKKEQNDLVKSLDCHKLKMITTNHEEVILYELCN